jgi:pimeloyl-ACP methyl ester carboxylesterase
LYRTNINNMNRLILITILIAALASCKPAAEESQNNLTAKDTTASNTQLPETGYADINGLKMYYEVHGQGKPIVLIHGSFMNIPMNWSGFIPLLSKDRKVIVAEMQGHGRTKDTDRELSYENMADDIAGLLGHLRVDSADILGYSMGGGVAFQFAVRHPGKLRRLVILSGTYKHDGWWLEAEQALATLTGDMFKGSPIQKQYDSLGNDPAHFNDHVKKVISIDLKRYDWSKEVKAIQAPIFMAIGDADGVRYEHALELYRAKGGGKMGDMFGLPKSRLAILPGTTHVGMMQRADLIVPMVTDFLNSDLSATPPSF